MPIERSREIRDRRDFGALCNFHELWQAVEVGVHRAEFAEHFIRPWRGQMLHLIDPWETYEETIYTDRERDLAIARERMVPYADRVRFIRERSPAALRHFPDGPRVDFVYIDGSHLYENVSKDIAAWWQRLTPGGILAGHDYDDEHDGVIRAVQEFMERENRTICLTYEGGTTPSWYTYKPLPPG